MPDFFLDRHQLLHSTDVDDVREGVEKIFCRHRMTLKGREKRLDARVHSHRMSPAIALNYVSYGGDVYVEPGRLDSFFVVQMPVSGKARIRCGREQTDTMPGLASVPRPTEHLSMRLSADCARLIIRIERPPLEALVRDVLDRPLDRPLAFALTMDLATGYGPAFQRMTMWLANELNRPDTLLAEPLIRTRVEQQVMLGLLRTQPCNYDLAHTGREHAAPHRVVRTVLELMESHPEWAHTATSLARAAGVTPKTVQNKFRQELECTPMDYLRNVRLQRVHDTLHAARPDEVRVHEVATRWGFLHLGHFAAAYRRRFDETPRQTLAR
ncbi:AraC family transcriptional regulator [Amycolatopsis alkalitolerans]|uniref:AraC family transcriptional regulator n=1 Tax=Amycolatopsis alkalitolerans TaxID=2547244 RepID=A0A5C4LPB9_9PSEU|nr:AraC family transcriptional regulator [Amycolatopsis alkalitolerans]TNC19264.1 AraC family transcriptional regulator [Amycolatopsis alkalitolerans]